VDARGCGNGGVTAARVAIYDTTLRDGTQAEGISLSIASLSASESEMPSAWVPSRSVVS